MVSQHRRFHYLLAWSLCLAAVFIFPLRPSADATAIAGADHYAKEELEAAYLYNFLLFVRSPRPASENRLTICILGDTVLGKNLQPMVGKKIKGSPNRLQVKIVTTNLQRDDITDCSLLFISASYKKKLPKILKDLRGLPILTVSDMPEFVAQGGMLGLVEKDSRLRWQINRYAADKVGLALHSQLLRNAVKVVDKPSPDGETP